MIMIQHSSVIIALLCIQKCWICWKYRNLLSVTVFYFSKCNIYNILTVVAVSFSLPDGLQQIRKHVGHRDHVCFREHVSITKVDFVSLILEATSHFFLLTLMMIHRITQDRNIPSVTAPRNMMKRITSTLRQFESEQSIRAPSVLFPATAPGNSCKNHNARLV